MRSADEEKALQEYKAEVTEAKRKMHARYVYVTPESQAKRGLPPPKNTVEATLLQDERRNAGTNSEERLKKKSENFVKYKQQFMADKSEKELHDKAYNLLANHCREHPKGVLKRDLDEMFTEAGFDEARFEQVFDELELEGKIYAGGYNLIYWDGPTESDDES
jgi:hypothetical protein